jgi:hypothetical protein
MAKHRPIRRAVSGSRDYFEFNILALAWLSPKSTRRNIRDQRRGACNSKQDKSLLVGFGDRPQRRDSLPGVGGFELANVVSRNTVNIFREIASLLWNVKLSSQNLRGCR